MSLEFVTVFFQSSYENWVGSTYRLGRKSPLSSPLALSISLELSSYLFPGDSMVDWWISKREWCRAHITLSFPLQLGNSPWNSMLSVFHSCFGDCCNSKLSRKDPLRSPSTLNFPLEIRDFRITDDREESIRLRRSDIFFCSIQWKTNFFAIRFRWNEGLFLDFWSFFLTFPILKKITIRESPPPSFPNKKKEKEEFFFFLAWQLRMMHGF